MWIYPNEALGLLWVLAASFILKCWKSLFLFKCGIIFFFRIKASTKATLSIRPRLQGAIEALLNSL